MSDSTGSIAVGTPIVRRSLPTKRGKPSTSSPRTTDMNRKRLGNLFTAFTPSSSSASDSPPPSTTCGTDSSSTHPLPQGSQSTGELSATSVQDLDESSAPVSNRMWSWMSSKRLGIGRSDDSENDDVDECGSMVGARSAMDSGIDVASDIATIQLDDRGEDGIVVSTQSKEECHFTKLPDELIVQILSHLPATVSQLHQISSVSLRFYSISHSPVLWSRVFTSSPGFQLKNQVKARAVATLIPPSGRWEGNGWVWNHTESTNQTSNPAESGVRGWFGRKRSSATSPKVESLTSPKRSAKLPSPNARLTSLLLSPSLHPSSDQPQPIEIHYPTLYRSRNTLMSSMRTPDPAVPSSKYSLEPAKDSVYCLKVKGRWLISGSRDRSIRIWRLPDVDEGDGNRGSSPSGQSYVDKEDDDDEIDRNLLGRNEVAELVCVHENAHDRSVLGLDFEEFDLVAEKKQIEGNRRFGKMITGSSDTTAGVWEIDWGSRQHVRKDSGGSKDQSQVRIRKLGTLTGHSGGVLDVALGRKVIVTCSNDGTLRVWDRQSHLQLHVLEPQGGPINSLSLGPDVSQMVSASVEGPWTIWDIELGLEVKRGVGEARGLACVVWAGDFILTGSNDKTIKIFSASSGDLLRTLTGHKDLVRALAVDVRLGLVFSASYDQTLRMWDLNTGNCIRQLPCLHSSLIFDLAQDGPRLYSASHDHTIQVLTFGVGLPYLDYLA